LVSTGQAKNAQFDREDLVTANNAYSFVNNPNPVTYSMNIAAMPPYNPGASGQSLARIILVPLSAGVPGTDTEPDFNYPTMLIMAVTRNSPSNCTATIEAKINQPSGNGSLFDPSNTNTTFNTTSPIEGNWSLTISGNNNILVTAPNGSSTNLPFPLSLSPSDVNADFNTGLGMVAYFGNQNNGGANEGTREVLAGASITGGVPFPAVDGDNFTYAPVNDNFVADTNIDVAVSVGDGHQWLIASDGTTQTNSLYLLSPTIKYFLDWSLPATGFAVQTNGNLAASSAWATNSAYSPLLLGTHFHVDVDKSTIPSNGNLFFRLNNQPSH
jgi:hypothetical protein